MYHRARHMHLKNIGKIALNKNHVHFRPSPTGARFRIHLNRFNYTHIHRKPVSCPLSNASESSEASIELEEEEEGEDFDSTRMKSMVKGVVTFSLPVIMVPLADPVMSLVDTISLGHLASSFQVAAVAPANLIFNFAFYSMTALSIATVSLTSERLRTGRGAGKIVSTSLFVGAVCGIVILIVLQCFGPSLLLKTGCDTALIAYSTEYLRIRSLAAPATITTMVSQAAFLGQRDSTTPFNIVVTSILLSLLGDIVLIGAFSMGIAGAAWTTVAAQYLSAVLLLRGLRNSKAAPPLEIPNWKDLKELLTSAATLGVFYFAKTTSYLFLSATAARLPAMQLAAHTAIWQLWGLCSFLNSPLEQASLAFLPAAKSLRQRKELTAILLAIGASIGVACSFIAHGVPAVFPKLLLADSTLWSTMQSIWLPGTIAMLCCGLDVSATGILIANKDMGFVARSMLISLFCLLSYLCIVTRIVPQYGLIANIPGIFLVWWGLAVFFIARGVQSVPRVFYKHFYVENTSTPPSSVLVAEM